MAEHPRPWTCKKARYVGNWFIDDANGNPVGEVRDEPTARYIVDLVNAAAVQQEMGVTVSRMSNGTWYARGGPMVSEFDFANEPHGNSFSTPHAAILAAAAWLKEKG